MEWLQRGREQENSAESDRSLDLAAMIRLLREREQKKNPAAETGPNVQRSAELQSFDGPVFEGCPNEDALVRLQVPLIEVLAEPALLRIGLLGEQAGVNAKVTKGKSLVEGSAEATVVEPGGESIGITCTRVRGGATWSRPERPSAVLDLGLLVGGFQGDWSCVWPPRRRTAVSRWVGLPERPVVGHLAGGLQHL